jgi:hypothetical protein
MYLTLGVVASILGGLVGLVLSLAGVDATTAGQSRPLMALFLGTAFLCGLIVWRALDGYLGRSTNRVFIVSFATSPSRPGLAVSAVTAGVIAVCIAQLPQSQQVARTVTISPAHATGEFVTVRISG